MGSQLSADMLYEFLLVLFSFLCLATYRQQVVLFILQSDRWLVGSKYHSRSVMIYGIGYCPEMGVKVQLITVIGRVASAVLLLIFI